MPAQYVSVSLMNELPKPLINFIWYLWDTYCDKAANESVILLRSSGRIQQVIIPTANKTTEQDFGIATDAVISIINDDSKYTMSRA